MSSFSHQDLKTVVIKRKTKTNRNYTGNGKKQHNEFDPDRPSKVKVSNRTLANAIQKARTEKKMSQTDVDNACNFPKNTVRNYENCKAVINPNQLNKLNRLFGVKLPRPRKN